MRESHRSKRTSLTAAGLIMGTAGTLLMLAWAVFPAPAFADGTYTWGQEDGTKNGANNLPCDGGHWNMFFDGTITSATLHVGGQSVAMSPQGNHWDADSVGVVDASTVVTVSWIGSGTAEFLTLSHCTGTPTTSTSPPSTSTTPPSTSTTPPSNSTTPPSSSTSAAPTTITPPDETTPPGGTTVSPTTVSPPGGTAFTGLENVIPLGVIALTMMTAGSGLMWAGTRRNRKGNEEEE